MAGRLRVLAVVATVGPGWGEDVAGVGEDSVTRVGEDNCSGSGTGRGTRRPPRTQAMELQKNPSTPRSSTGQWWRVGEPSSMGKMHGRMSRGGTGMEDGCGCTVTDVWTWACIGNI